MLGTPVHVYEEPTYDEAQLEDAVDALRQSVEEEDAQPAAKQARLALAEEVEVVASESETHW